MHIEPHQTGEWFTLLIKILRTFLLGDQMLLLLQRIVKGKRKTTRKKKTNSVQQQRCRCLIFLPHLLLQHDIIWYLNLSLNTDA